MSSNLEKGSEKSRLELSIEAIKMFISLLRPNDSFGMVVFNQVGHLIIEQQFKKDLSNSVFDKLETIVTNGGTKIANGMVKSKQVLLDFVEEEGLSGKCENRIIMLTDVCDNSIEGSLEFVKEASNNESVFLTIVGISNEFRSETCEALKNVKGFNYFCAVSHEDIKKNIF